MNNAELLDRLKKYSPQNFEKFVLDFLLKIQNSDFGEVMGKTGDEGIDGYLRMDKLELGNVYFQAKRWESTVVGRPEVQKFVGALHGKKAAHGVFVTTSSFTKEAREYAKHVDKRVRLIDGEEIVKLVIENNLQSLIKEELVLPFDISKFPKAHGFLSKVLSWSSKSSKKLIWIIGIFCGLAVVGQCTKALNDSSKRVEKHPAAFVDNRPSLSVGITYRTALLSKGLVAKFKNESKRKLKFLATFTNPTLNQSKSFPFSIRPNHVVEFGHLEGWDFKPGDEITLRSEGYKPLVEKVP